MRTPELRDFLGGILEDLNRPAVDESDPTAAYRQRVLARKVDIVNAELAGRLRQDEEPAD